MNDAASRAAAQSNFSFGKDTMQSYIAMGQKPSRMLKAKKLNTQLAENVREGWGSRCNWMRGSGWAAGAGCASLASRLLARHQLPPAAHQAFHGHAPPTPHNAGLHLQQERAHRQGGQGGARLHCGHE